MVTCVNTNTACKLSICEYCNPTTKKILREVTELEPGDVFTHLNGKDYWVTSVDWAGGDNYKISCMDVFRNDAEFVCDVHTQLQMKFIAGVEVGA
jgi:hypothetical protein